MVEYVFVWIIVLLTESQDVILTHFLEWMNPLFDLQECDISQSLTFFLAIGKYS